MVAKKTFDKELLNKEYIITNGIGGYASSSICGANTRRYHGLLVASMSPPTDRRVLVSKVEERVKIDGKYHDLSVNEYPETIHPQGYQYLQSFERKPLPLWKYSGGDWSLDKKVFMMEGVNATVLVYTNTGKIPINLEVHPLLVDKDYHAVYREDSRSDFYYVQKERQLKIHAHYGSDAFYINASKGSFVEERGWYKNVQLHRDKYRGQKYEEDYYRIGFYDLKLDPGQKVTLIFSTDESVLNKKSEPIERAILNKIESLKDSSVKDEFYNDLLVSGDQFVVKRASTDSYTILAGYHWFTDWGRDTMIAMRGLTIALGKKKESESILSTFFKYLDKGMLPNRFPDYAGQEIEYNTIDATLWLFVALYDYYRKFKDKNFIKKYMDDLQSVIDAHIEGTRYNIKVTEEGLLYGGREDVQLTWMDAITDGKVWTPRIGCPVEINALWYNVLCIYDYFVEELKPKVYGDYSNYQKLIKSNFIKYFLNEKGYLNDVVVPDSIADASFKSNQLYPLSLPFRLLSEVQEKEILKQVGEKLLTPYGVRTLAMDDPNFVSVYGGDQATRDHSYHQGVVWPFIISEYYEPYLRLNKNSVKAKKQVKKELEALKKHFYEADCLYGISEIFDGANPKDGRGTIQQAWSISAIVKLYNEFQLYDI
ncbi:MAG: glycogen debranching enzyme N-terminal domain-containing protein [Flavobacteriales bacterium]|nr:glycogen debranching enzyme N-terminal domain-containing protein [Flavobacteriales bacterium]